MNSTVARDAMTEAIAIHGLSSPIAQRALVAYERAVHQDAEGQGRFVAGLRPTGEFRRLRVASGTAREGHLQGSGGTTSARAVSGQGQTGFRR
jgi:hypothetical protein